MYSLSKERLGHTEASACPSLRFDVEKSFLDAVHARGRSVAKPRSVPALDNTRLSFQTSKTAGRRRERYKLREVLWEVSSLPRLRKCGKVPIASLVALRGGKGEVSGFSGLAICGSPHSCVVCSSRISVARTREIEQLIEYAKANGLYVSMLTLTIRHSKGDRLASLWDALSDGWHSVTGGVRWQEFKAQMGLKHWVKSIECTVNERHGFNLHQHVLICSEKDPSKTPFIWQRKQGRAKKPYPPEIMKPQDFIADRWEKGLAKTGKTFLRDKGMDWSTAENALAMGRYVAKMQGQGNLAAEMALGGFKKGREHKGVVSRTPFQVLADFSLYGDAEDLAIWHEWEQASHNRRGISWSRGTKAEIGLEERSDEEIAQEEVGGDSVVLTLDKCQWRKVVKHGSYNLLEALEKFGEFGARAWCDERGIEWRPPEVGKYRDP